MKVLRLVFATLAIGVASIPAAQARDSFSIGLNFGSPYYVEQYQPPVVRYYPTPPAYYYGAPPVYYRSAPPVYYAPQASFGYWNGGNRGWGGHRRHDDDHEEHHWRHHGHDGDD